MANKQLINGKVYDWSSVTITASGMENMEPMEISYDDEQESEPIYGKGGKIRGYGTGNQKNSVKLSLLREDFNEMCRVIKSKGYKNFYKMPTKRFDKKHWKMVVVLLAICGAMLLLRWAAMIWG